MFYTVLQSGGVYRAGQLIDVVVYDSNVKSLRVRASGTGLPNGMITVAENGNLTGAPSNTGDNPVTVSVLIDSADIRDYFVVATSNNSGIYNRTLFIEALSDSGNVLKSESFYVHSPNSVYKKVSLIPSYESAKAEYNARLSQIRAARSKSYIWRVNIVLDPPPAPEEFYPLPATQVFGMEAIFEPRAYGQGFDMISTGQLLIPFASLAPATDRLFVSMMQRIFERQEAGLFNAGRGVAMIEFYNEDYSWVINDVPIAAQPRFNANGLENNANENASGLLVILSGKSMLELVSGFTHLKPI
jgi:hypothetical protein